MRASEPPKPRRGGCFRRCIRSRWLLDASGLGGSSYLNEFVFRFIGAEGWCSGCLSRSPTINTSSPSVPPMPRRAGIWSGRRESPVCRLVKWIPQ